MYTTIKNTSSVTILWKILCNFSLFKQGKAGQGSADLAVIGVLGPSPVIKLQLPPAAALVKLPQLQLPAGLQGKARGNSSSWYVCIKKFACSTAP